MSLRDLLERKRARDALVNAMDNCQGVPAMDLTGLEPQSLDPILCGGPDDYTYKVAAVPLWENMPTAALALGDMDSTPLDNGDVGDDRPAHYVVYREGK